MSIDYPQLQVTPSDGESTCVITLPKYSTGSLKFLDVGYTFTQESPCPVRITVCEESRCAELGTQIYPDIILKPSAIQEDLNFYDVHLMVKIDTFVNQVKLWLEVSG